MTSLRQYWALGLTFFNLIVVNWFLLKDMDALWARVINIGLLIMEVMMGNYLAQMTDGPPYSPIHRTRVGEEPMEKIFFDGLSPIAPMTEDLYVVVPYKFRTKDGYDLVCFRIMQKDSTGELRALGPHPVIICHGLTGASDNAFMADTAPGYFFVYNKYDLWCVNLRGNKYSIGHENPNIHPKEFFNYTIHEHGLIDIPCYYENILRETGVEKLTYVGNSMGGVIHIIAMSDPSCAGYINEHTKRVIYYNPLIYNSFCDDPYSKEYPCTREIQEEI
jgi:pimeloyl-ACP methyl ester carboxylesterase